AQGIGRLTDVRTIPRSRHNPQFNRDRLPDDLARAGIAYVHMPGLGGLRRPRSDSVNLAWRNSSFRGYADYMQTEAFQSNLDVLVRQAAGARTAIVRERRGFTAHATRLTRSAAAEAPWCGERTGSAASSKSSCPTATSCGTRRFGRSTRCSTTTSSSIV